MTPDEIYLTKTALRILDSAGPQGLSRCALLEQTGITAQRPLTTADGNALLDRLFRKEWSASYTDPITD